MTLPVQIETNLPCSRGAPQNPFAASTVLKELLNLGWQPLALMVVETLFMVLAVGAVVLVTGGPS